LPARRGGSGYLPELKIRSKSAAEKKGKLTRNWHQHESKIAEEESKCQKHGDGISLKPEAGRKISAGP
jgi:hypothetical protein